jgi:hypothetical protein
MTSPMIQSTTVDNALIMITLSNYSKIELERSDNFCQSFVIDMGAFLRKEQVLNPFYFIYDFKARDAVERHFLLQHASKILDEKHASVVGTTEICESLYENEREAFFTHHGFEILNHHIVFRRSR